jgi:hypothetical protein
MRAMRIATLMPVLALPICAGKFRPLFDGKTLQGWKVATGSAAAWKVDSAMIIGVHGGAAAYDHLVCDSVYADFTLRFQFQWIRGNSGFFFRGELAGASGMSGHQVLTTGDVDAAGLWETHGRNWIIAPNDKLRSFYLPDAWNRWVVKAYRRHITLYLNDSLVGDLPDDPGRLQGRFALKLHGGGAAAEVRVKNVEVADTTRRGCTNPAAPNYDPWAFQDDGSCRTVGILSKRACAAGSNLRLGGKHRLTFGGSLRSINGKLPQ